MGSVPSGTITIRDGVKCTSWMSADELVNHLEEGDLVEFDRDLYKHWGVFVQKDPTDGIYYIVHLSGDVSEQSLDSLMSSKYSGDSKLRNTLGASLQLNGEIAIVQTADLKLVANGRRCRVNNLRDYEFRPYSPSAIVARAMSEIGKQKYNALFTNCEHFSTWCRYGTKSSNQANTFKAVTTGVVVGVASSSVAYGALTAGAVYMASRLGRQAVNRLARGKFPW